MLAAKKCQVIRSVCQLLVAACVVPSSPILVTLMKEALGTSETSVRARRRNILEDTILHSHRRENLKSYIPQIYIGCMEEKFVFPSVCYWIKPLNLEE
jgi:hypothetical protein